MASLMVRCSLVAVLVALAGCVAPRPVPEGAQVVGAVVHRERIALPPDAVVAVRLEHVSRADSPAVMVDETRVATEGRQVPIPFVLRYDPARIVPSDRYAVRAEIRDADGTLRWTSTQSYPVLTHGASAGPVVIVLEPVRASGATQGHALAGSSWRLVHLEQPGEMNRAPMAGEAYTLAFSTDGRASGQAHCNRITGAYTPGEAPGALSFGDMAATRAFCGERSMDRDVLAVLDAVGQYSLVGARLRLAAPDGQTLVFERHAAPDDASLGMEAEARPGRTFVFDCPAPDGTTDFSVTTRTGTGEAAVWLPPRFGNRSVVLSQTPAASGARYEGDGVVFWNRGDEALFEIGGRRVDGCRSNPSRAVWEEARLSGVTFRAIGQEPGWVLDVLRTGRLRWTTMDGASTEYDPPDVALDGRRTIYRVMADGAVVLVATVAPERCTDVMSGEAFVATVTVETGGRTLHGCGRPL